MRSVFLTSIAMLSVVAMSGVGLADELCDAADVNGDLVVDPLDSGYALSRFGCPVGTGDGACDSADANADGLVDPLDTGFILSRFGCPVTPPTPPFTGPLFGNPEFPVGDHPYSVTAADLDGDGDLDLATANFVSGNVSVLLNNGDGTFEEDALYGAGNEPDSVTAADLDSDSDLDLAVANYGYDYGGGDNVSVLLNNGDGTFAADVLYGAGDYPASVTAADLDGDSDLDLAVANYGYDYGGGDNVSVLLNRRIE